MRSFRLLALGDSYTIGEGVAPADRWPVQLVARLRQRGVAVADPVIVAQTGWTTDELAAAMDTSTFAPPYALVTLLIGVNDQYRGWPLDEYQRQFRMLLQHAIALAADNAGHVIAVSIPDWSVTPFASREGRDPAVVARTIDAFNGVARGEADAAGARWVDVTLVSRSSDMRDALVADGLHPSGTQYTRWVDAILPAAAAALQGG